MKNVYFGTSDFAATVLARLARSPHRPSLVVTRPARPKGRGKKLQDPPVAELAHDLAIPVHQPDDVNSEATFDFIGAERPEALTVCAFGAIIKDPLLTLAPTFNVHPSLLPRWRGAAPVERAVQAGDEETGVTIMRLVEELDAGPYCLQAREDIRAEDDYGTLAPRLADIGAELLVEALTSAEDGSAKWTEQLDGHSEADITYAEKIVREDRVLLPRTQTANQIEFTIRALTPHIGAMFETESGDPLRVEAAKISLEEVAAGEVNTETGSLLVGTVEGTIELLRVKPAGGKAMDVESYLRGNDAPRIVG